MTSDPLPPKAGALSRWSDFDGWKALWMATMTVGIFLVARDMMLTRASDHSIMGAALWGRDFVNVYTSGSLTLTGHLDILYNVPAYRAYQLDLFHAGLTAHNYSYPPVTLLYTWLFALVPYPVALLAWLGGTGALFVRAARPYMKEAGLAAWLAVVAPASVINIWAGHYGFLVGALWLGAWHILPRRPALAGLLIGLMVVKPHLAILAPLVLLWRREWIAIAAAAATVAILVGLSLLLFGPQLWVTYLTDTALVQVGMVDNVRAFFISMMPTVMPAMAILGAPLTIAGIAQAVFAVAAVVLLLKKLPKDSAEAGLATATATFLVLPYAFSYDMTVVSLAGLLLYRQSIGRAPGWFRFAAWMAALTPIWMAALALITIILLDHYAFPIAPLLIFFQLWALVGWRQRERAKA